MATQDKFYEELNARVENAKKAINFYAEKCKEAHETEFSNYRVRGELTDDELVLYARGRFMLNAVDAPTRVETSSRGRRKVVQEMVIMGGVESPTTTERIKTHKNQRTEILTEILQTDEDNILSVNDRLEDCNVTTIEEARRIISETSSEDLIRIGSSTLARYMATDIRNAMYPD